MCSPKIVPGLLYFYDFIHGSIGFILREEETCDGVTNPPTLEWNKVMQWGEINPPTWQVLECILYLFEKVRTVHPYSVLHNDKETC